MVLPLYETGGQVGTLTVCEKGEGVELVAEAECPVAGIYRLSLRLREGCVPLGLMEQRGQGLFLKRTIQRRAIAPLGIPICGEMVLSYIYPEPKVWKKITVPRLKELGFPFWEELPGDSIPEYRQEHIRRLLRFGCQCGLPFPVPSLFCLASIQKEEGREWVYLAFSEEWYPQFYKKPDDFEN